MSYDKKQKNKELNDRRQNFLLTFFSSDPHYDIREVNGYILVKQKNNNNDTWQVAIHTKETWSKVQDWMQRTKEAGNEPLPLQDANE